MGSPGAPFRVAAARLGKAGYWKSAASLFATNDGEQLQRKAKDVLMIPADMKRVEAAADWLAYVEAMPGMRTSDLSWVKCFAELGLGAS